MLTEERYNHEASQSLRPGAAKMRENVWRKDFKLFLVLLYQVSSRLAFKREFRFTKGHQCDTALDDPHFITSMSDLFSMNDEPDF